MGNREGFVVIQSGSAGPAGPKPRLEEKCTGTPPTAEPACLPACKGERIALS